MSSNLVMSDRRVSRRVRRESEDLWARRSSLKSHFSTVSASDVRRGSCKKESLFPYGEVCTFNKVSIMMKRKGDYQKHAVDEDRLLRIPKEHTTYAQMAARQSEQQRIRNADALARARSVARHAENR